MSDWDMGRLQWVREQFVSYESLTTLGDFAATCNFRDNLSESQLRREKIPVKLESRSFRHKNEWTA